MAENAPFLPGLSPVSGKPVHLAFDGGRLPEALQAGIGCRLGRDYPPPRGRSGSGRQTRPRGRLGSPPRRRLPGWTPKPSRSATARGQAAFRDCRPGQPRPLTADPHAAVANGQKAAPTPSSISIFEGLMMTKMRKKAALPTKICPVCERPFTWRKKWARDWSSVVYCSARCRGSGRVKASPSAK